MTRWLSIVFLLTTMSAAVAMEDTPENREEQVERYLQAVPPQPVFEDMLRKMFSGLPADQREIFTGDMNKVFDFRRSPMSCARRC